MIDIQTNNWKYPAKPIGRYIDALYHLIMGISGNKADLNDEVVVARLMLRCYEVLEANSLADSSIEFLIQDIHDMEARDE